MKIDEIIKEERVDELFKDDRSAYAFTKNTLDDRCRKLITYKFKNFNVRFEEDYNSFWETNEKNSWDVVFEGETGGFNDARMYKTQHFKIYSTLINIFRKFVEEEDPKKIHFCGFSEKQNSVYNRMLISLSNEIKSMGFKVDIMPIQGGNPIINLIRESRIDELFDNRTKIPIQWSGDNAKFETPNGTKICFKFAPIKERHIVLDRQYSVEFYDEVKNSFSPTGSGEPFLVYATFFAVMKEFLKERKPDVLRFNGFTSKQQKLYYVLMKKWETGFNAIGYRVEMDNSYWDDNRPYFAIIKGLK